MYAILKLHLAPTDKMLGQQARTHTVTEQQWDAIKAVLDGENSDSHDQLVAALQRAKRYIASNGGGSSEHGEVVDIIRAALTAAGAA